MGKEACAWLRGGWARRKMTPLFMFHECVQSKEKNQAVAIAMDLVYGSLEGPEYLPG